MPKGSVARQPTASWKGATRCPSPQVPPAPGPRSCQPRVSFPLRILSPRPNSQQPPLPICNPHHPPRCQRPTPRYRRPQQPPPRERGWLLPRLSPHHHHLPQSRTLARRSGSYSGRAWTAEPWRWCSRLRRRSVSRQNSNRGGTLKPRLC